jgi:hypothetical protein
MLHIKHIATAILSGIMLHQHTAINAIISINAINAIIALIYIKHNAILLYAYR